MSDSAQRTLGNGNYYVGGNYTIDGTGDATMGNGDYYIGGDLTLSGSGKKTLGSGTYFIGGKLTIFGSGNVVGNDVVFVLLKGGSMTNSGSGTLTLTAPKTGKYAGFVVVQARGNENPLVTTGSGGFQVTGIIYAPAAPITVSGSGGAASQCVRFIGSTINMSGSGGIKGDCQDVLAGQDLVMSEKSVALTY